MLCVINMVRDALTDCDSVLDVGCGSGWVMNELHKKRMVGIEGDVQTAKEAEKNVPSAQIINAEAFKTIKEFSDKSFDAVIMIDVLEHFDKETGREMIKEVHRVARKKIVIFSPMGFVENDYSKNPLNRHLSGWDPDEFQTLDYVTVIIPHYHLYYGDDKKDVGAFIAMKQKPSEWRLKKIPKVAFFYWGESVLPYLRYKTLETFCRHNRDWKVKLYVPAFPHSGMTWTTHEQKVPIYARDYSAELKHLPIEIIKFDFKDIGVRNDIPCVYKSDFLRMFLLSAEGGLWSDMDIIYFKPVEDMTCNSAENALADVFVSICEYGHSIGFMMAATGNAYFSKLFHEAKQRFSQDSYQSIGSILYNRLFPTVEKIRDAGIQAVNIPMDTVYAYNALWIKSIFESGDMCKYTPGSIGLHWYAGHPLAGDAINKVVDGMMGDNVLMKTLEIAG